MALETITLLFGLPKNRTKVIIYPDSGLVTVMNLNEPFIDVTITAEQVIAICEKLQQVRR